MVLTSVESLEPDRAPIGRDAVTAVPAASGHSASDRFDRRSGANVQIRLLGGIRAETVDGEVTSLVYTWVEGALQRFPILDLTTEDTLPATGVRAVHASPDAPAVDVLANDVLPVFTACGRACAPEARTLNASRFRFSGSGSIARIFSRLPSASDRTASE